MSNKITLDESQADLFDAYHNAMESLNAIYENKLGYFNRKKHLKNLNEFIELKEIHEKKGDLSEVISEHELQRLKSLYEVNIENNSRIRGLIDKYSFSFPALAHHKRKLDNEN